MHDMGKRLKKLRTSLSLTQTEFAERIGKKLRTVQDYEAGIRGIDATVGKLLSYEFGVNPEWMRNGEGGMLSYERVEDGECLIPLYNVYASAGYGAWANGESVVGYYKMPITMVKREWKAQPKNIAMLHVKGDSMIPLLQNGDLVAIDCSRKEAVKGLYVCRIENDLYIKNVAFQDKVVVLSSENTSYEPIVTPYE
ncbi:MAG: XRE family transcriptional regulator, partial [Deferribacteraceae bacterium]|nr:XRE family transcriptional regulator [Deferribacteraceae bacterium]